MNNGGNFCWQLAGENPEKNAEGGGGRRRAWAGLCGPKKKTENKKKGKRAGLSPVRKGKKERREVRKKEGGKKGK